MLRWIVVIVCLAGAYALSIGAVREKLEGLLDQFEIDWVPRSCVRVASYGGLITWAIMTAAYVLMNLIVLIGDYLVVPAWHLFRRVHWPGQAPP